jgi:serine O-acetyltransferase
MTKEDLFALIKSDWYANGRDWTKPGFQTLVIYRYGCWCSTIKIRMLRGIAKLPYRFFFVFTRNFYGIEFPHSVKAGAGITIEHQGCIVIHGNCVIGDHCIIRQGVSMGNRYMDRPLECPILGNGVQVGAGAKLLGGINIGDGAVIGANAVVLDDVAAGQTVIGIPAKPI